MRAGVRGPDMRAGGGGPDNPKTHLKIIMYKVIIHIKLLKSQAKITL